MSLNKQQQGFTLLEMAVVLVIIGLMAGMILPTHRHTQRLSEVKQVQSELRTIRDALQAYAVVYKKLPCPAVSFDENDSNGGKTSYNAAGTACKSGAHYLPWRDLGVPARDRWGRPWEYRVDKNFVEEIKVNSEAADDFVVQKLKVHGSGYQTTIKVDKKHVAAVIFSQGELKPDALISDAEKDNLNPSHKKISMMDDVLYDGSDGGPKGVNDIVTWISVLPLKSQLSSTGAVRH